MDIQDEQDSTVPIVILSILWVHVKSLYIKPEDNPQISQINADYKSENLDLNLWQSA